MASKYSVLDYDSDKERERDPDGPPNENLTSAALYVATILRAKSISYALMGGYNLKLRGSPRRTRDIDMCLQAPMKTVWDVVTPASRLIIPDSRNISGVMKIFVRTGPGYDNCSEKRNVECDLIEAGANGSPMSIENERVPLAFRHGATGQQMAFQGLNLHYMIRSKLKACSNRGDKRDYTDVVFLIETYPKEARALLPKFDEDLVDDFLEGLTQKRKEQIEGILGMGGKGNKLSRP